MIQQTISEEDFRSDKAAVKALNDFLASAEGQKFAAALRGGEPLNILASPENRTTKGIRDLAVVESANPHNLLGVCKGYKLAMNFIDLLAVEKKPGNTKTSSHLSSVSQALNAGPPNGP